jgi:hypothetical protein
LYSGISMVIRGKEPWTLSHGGKIHWLCYKFFFYYV